MNDLQQGSGNGVPPTPNTPQDGGDVSVARPALPTRPPSLPVSPPQPSGPATPQLTYQDGLLGAHPSTPQAQPTPAARIPASDPVGDIRWTSAKTRTSTPVLMLIFFSGVLLGVLGGWFAHTALNPAPQRVDSITVPTDPGASLEPTPEPVEATPEPALPVLDPEDAQVEPTPSVAPETLPPAVELAGECTDGLRWEPSVNGCVLDDAPTTEIPAETLIPVPVSS